MNRVWPFGSNPKYGAPVMGCFSSSIISPLFTVFWDFSPKVF
jgi:hypothetical protein